MGNANLEEGFKVRSNNKSWTLVAGALLILAACVLAYVLTKPAEGGCIDDLGFANTFYRQDSLNPFCIFGKNLKENDEINLYF